MFLNGLSKDLFVFISALFDSGEKSPHFVEICGNTFPFCATKTIICRLGCVFGTRLWFVVGAVSALCGRLGDPTSFSGPRSSFGLLAVLLRLPLDWRGWRFSQTIDAIVVKNVVGPIFFIPAGRLYSLNIELASYTR